MCQNSPSVQMQDIPPDAFDEDVKMEKIEDDPDVRISQDLDDKIVEPKNEFYDGEKDQDKTDTET